MALSFTEKQYWRNRIEKTVNNKTAEFQTLCSKIIEEINIKADCQVTNELNINDDLAAYQSREKEIAELQAAQKDLLSVIAVDVYGDDLPYRISLTDIEREVERLIEERADSLFSQHPLGQHLEALENEKARLLDAILLATNVQQVGDIMDEANALEPLPKLDEQDQQPEEPQFRPSDYSIQ